MIAESGLERPVQEELVDAVANCLKLCARAEAEGLQIGDLLTRSRPAAPASLDGPSDSAWPTIIQVIQQLLSISALDMTPLLAPFF